MCFNTVVHYVNNPIDGQLKSIYFCIYTNSAHVSFVGPLFQTLHGVLHGEPDDLYLPPGSSTTAPTVSGADEELGDMAEQVNDEPEVA